MIWEAQIMDMNGIDWNQINRRECLNYLISNVVDIVRDVAPIRLTLGGLVTGQRSSHGLTAFVESKLLVSASSRSVSSAANLEACVFQCCLIWI